MAEYIEREALLDAIDKLPNVLEWCFHEDDVVDMARDLPAADVVEVKRGRWIEHDCFKCNSRGEPVIKTGAVFVCSECGREERYREPFCHCGADMREENDAN